MGLRRFSPIWKRCLGLICGFLLAGCGRAAAVAPAEGPSADASRSSRSRQGYLVRRGDATITVRVPAAVFQETLAGVDKLGDELHREVSGRDVTEEYADLEIRLRNAEVVRQKKLGLSNLLTL